VTAPGSSYKGFRFPPEIISYCVWQYHRFPLSFREVEELMLVRGVIVSYETIRQWCAKFGPEYGTVIPEGAGCVKRLLSSGFAGFRAPCRQHWVRAGVKTERPQRSEDERS